MCFVEKGKWSLIIEVLGFDNSLPDEFKFFMKRLPTNYFLNTSTIMHLWTMDSNFQRRYEQLENSMKQLFLKAQKIVHKLFSLSKRCQKQPFISLPRQR